jgi:hypothetical protein
MVPGDLQNMAWRIAEMERKEHPCRRRASLLGMPAWGDVLLGGRLGAGSLVELFAAEEGAGAWTLALFMARHACGRRKVLVVADAERRFYPPAASRLNIDLRRTIVIRPKKGQPHHRARSGSVPARRASEGPGPLAGASGWCRESAHGDLVLAAMTQSLRCAAVGAAIGRVDRLSTIDQRRLQVAAESGGGVGFLLRPAAALSIPSFATVRLLITPVAPLTVVPGASVNLARRIQVEVVRFRGSQAGQSSTSRGGLTPRRSPLVLEIDDEKGHVHLPASMADAKSPAPPARASG